MRAKLSFPISNVNEKTLQGQLQEQSWCPIDVKNELTPDLNKRLNDFIGQLYIDDQVKAKSGKLFLITEDNYSIIGLVSKEDDNFYVIRFSNESVSKLQFSCEKIVGHIISLYNTKTIKINFEKVLVRETKSGHIAIEGDVFTDEKSKVSKARDDKKFEFLSAVILCSVALLFSLITLPSIVNWLFIKGEWTDWTIDILKRLMGSFFATSLVSYLNYRVYLNKLINTNAKILWTIKSSID